MSKLELSYSGYVCAPYLHNHESIELKDLWIKSKNIEKLFFATGTFSSDSKPYFSESSNHYLVAKFKDNHEIAKDLTKYNQDKISFVFDKATVLLTTINFPERRIIIQVVHFENRISTL